MTNEHVLEGGDQSIKIWKMKDPTTQIKGAWDESIEKFGDQFSQETKGITFQSQGWQNFHQGYLNLCTNLP